MNQQFRKIATASARLKCKRLADRHGRAKIERLLGVSRHTFANIVAGFDAQITTVAHVESMIDKIEAELDGASKQEA